MPRLSWMLAGVSFSFMAAWIVCISSGKHQVVVGSIDQFAGGIQTLTQKVMIHAKGRLEAQ